MLLPKVSPEVCDNVYREATRYDLLEYSKEKALELSKQNRALSEVIHALATQTSEGDRELYRRIYFALLVVVNIINNQIEVDDLKESWN